MGLCPAVRKKMKEVVRSLDDVGNELETVAEDMDKESGKLYDLVQAINHIVDQLKDRSN